MGYKVKVAWETDGEAVGLPDIVEIPDEVVEDEGGEIADYLSDNYGWLINGVEILKEKGGKGDQ